MRVNTLSQMCKYTVSMKKKRNIVIWGSNHFALNLQHILNKIYDLEISYFVDNEKEIIDFEAKKTDILLNNSSKYFILVTKLIDNKILTLIKNYGFSDNDFIYMDLHLNNYFKEKTGIEIGGPSQFFYKIYNTIKVCDGVNFSDNTVWSHTDKSKGYFYRENRLGEFYLTDGVKLSNIKESYYDFLFSSNNLEHIANPILAVMKWKKVVKKGGDILIIVPNKEFSFDHKREYTTFDHLMNDYNNNVSEKDLYHLNEILEKHDLNIDLKAGNFEKFKNRSLKNFKNRCLHHHVFSKSVLIKIFEYCNIQTIDCSDFRECYYILGKI